MGLGSLLLPPFFCWRASLWVKRQATQKLQPLKVQRSRPVKPLFELFYACDVLQPLAIEQVIRPESATALAQYKRPRTRL